MVVRILAGKIKSENDCEILSRRPHILKLLMTYVLLLETPDIKLLWQINCEIYTKDLQSFLAQELGLSSTNNGNVKWQKPFWKPILQFAKKGKYIHTLRTMFTIQRMKSIWPLKKNKLYVNIHSSYICNSPNWKQPPYSSFCEWVNKPCYIYTTEYNFAMERIGLLIYAPPWMKCKKAY